MQQLIIIGAGGFGREVLAWAEEAVEHLQQWTIKGLLDDNPQALDGYATNRPLLGAVSSHQPVSDEVFVCAIGAIAAKRKCVEMLQARGARFTTVTHRSVVQGHRVNVGAGVILCPGVVVASDVTLADFVTVNLQSTVAHDAVVGAFAQVHCHVDITGGVRIGREVLIGSHASLLPGVTVGDGAIVGAGAVVVRDVAPHTTVFGNPARALPAASA